MKMIEILCEDFKRSSRR